MKYQSLEMPILVLITHDFIKCSNLQTDVHNHIFKDKNTFQEHFELYNTQRRQTIVKIDNH